MREHGGPAISILAKHLPMGKGKKKKLGETAASSTAAPVTRSGVKTAFGKSQQKSATSTVGQSAKERATGAFGPIIGRLREALTPDSSGEVQPIGRRFRVTLLQEGLGNFEDCFYYTAECIESAVPIFEGKKFFIDHPDAIEEEARPERSVRDVGGYFENIAAERDQDGCMCLVGDLVTLDSPDIEPIRARMVEAVRYAMAHPGENLMGLSINAGGDFEKIGIEQFMRETAIPDACIGKLREAINRGVQVIRPVSRMTFAKSCDLVTEAGAGGRISQILEHRKGTMSTKAKKESAKDEEKKKSTAAKLKESEEAVKESKEDAGDGDADTDDGDEHDDADQDKELIQAMMKKYLGDGFTDEDHSMAQEAYQHAMEACGGDQAEAEKMAGYSIKMARHMKQKGDVDGGGAPDANETPADGAPAPKKMARKDQVAEHAAGGAASGGAAGGAAGAGGGHGDAPPPQQQSNKESAKGGSSLSEIAKLTGENARLKAKIEELELGHYIDETLRESRLPMSATKKFRECIKDKKSKQAVKEAFAVFKEAFLSAGEGDGFGFIINGEKQTGNGGSSDWNFSDCTVED